MEILAFLAERGPTRFTRLMYGCSSTWEQTHEDILALLEAECIHVEDDWPEGIRSIRAMKHPPYKFSIIDKGKQVLDMSCKLRASLNLHKLQTFQLEWVQPQFLQPLAVIAS